MAIVFYSVRDSKGVDLITGYNPTDVEQMNLDNINYCRITINKFNRIETIVSLSKTVSTRLKLYYEDTFVSPNYVWIPHTQKPNVMKFKAIWGLNENTCLNLRLRYEAGMIQDLHEFFTRPWIYMVYHDRFKSALKDPCRDMLYHAHFKNHELIDEISDRIVANQWQSVRLMHLFEHYRI